MEKVAVVILNYNGEQFLKKFLPSVVKHSHPHKVIVADNCSTDHSIELLNEFPSVEKVILNENYGYAGGYNQALKQIEAEYFVLLNSDVEVTPNWLNPLTEFLDSNPAYAAAQPKILSFYNRDFFEYAGAAGGFIDTFGYPFCRGRVFDSVEKDVGQYDQVTDIFWTSGACMMIRSEVFHQLGGFDSEFFAHMEEIDLCWRMKSAGWKAAFIPTSSIYHVGGGTLNKTSPKKTFLNFRNGISVLIKNLPRKKLIWILPIRILLDWVASLLLWRNNSYDHFAAVWKAHFQSLSSSRNNINSIKRSNTAINGQKPALIPFEYYIRGKKTYSDINNTK